MNGQVVNAIRLAALTERILAATAARVTFVAPLQLVDQLFCLVGGQVVQADDATLVVICRGTPTDRILASTDAPAQEPSAPRRQPVCLL